MKTYRISQEENKNYKQNVDIIYIHTTSSETTSTVFMGNRRMKRGNVAEYYEKNTKIFNELLKIFSNILRFATITIRTSFFL